MYFFRYCPTLHETHSRAEDSSESVHVARGGWGTCTHACTRTRAQTVDLTPPRVNTHEEDKWSHRQGGEQGERGRR